MGVGSLSANTAINVDIEARDMTVMNKLKGVDE